jgi:hypothetical protein
MDRYGIAILGQEPDIKLILRAAKLASVHRVFSKLAAVGVKNMAPADFIFIRDTMKEME